MRKSPVESAKDRTELKEAFHESVAEDERTHGQINRMERMIKKIARKAKAKSED